MSAAAAMLLSATVSSTVSMTETLRLQLGSCVEDRDMVHDLVAIELGFDRLVDGPAARVVDVECSGPVLVVRISPNPEGLLERLVLVADAAQDQGSRLVALNIVELVQEAESRTPSTPVVAPAIRSTPTPARPPSRSVRARIGAAPTLRLSPGPNGPGWGGRVSFGLDAAASAALPWSLFFDLGFEESTVSSSLGRARTRVVPAAVGVGVRLELSSALSFFGHGLIRGGWAFVEGQSGDANRIDATAGDGPWWGPALGLRIRYGDAVGVALGIEGGSTVQGVYGQVPEGTVGVRGAWLTADLCVDWSLGD